MSKFLTGFGAGLVAAGLVTGGLAWAQQQRIFPPPSAHAVGLSNSALFTVVCTTANGSSDPTRKMIVMRPLGDNSADVTLRCDPR